MLVECIRVVALATLIIYGIGYPLDEFYPFGSAEGDRNLPANDDYSTRRIQISVPFPFFGSSYNSVFVNNNGDVTFSNSLVQFTSEPFPINGSHKIIAPFWTDIDTRRGGSLWYRTTTDKAVLQQGSNETRTLFPEFTDFSASWMMIVTWKDVAAYGCSRSSSVFSRQISCGQRNTFQLILITNGIQSFVVFYYYSIQWTKSAQVGFNAGDGVNYYAVNGSMTDSVLHLPQMSNIGIPGKFVFRVDLAEIANADVIDECASSPCVYGNCTNEYLLYVCVCQQGYTGINCETEINECENSSCIHGNCSDHLNYYTCDCQAGYNGSNCQTEINECESSPCIHGNCSDHISYYTCDCQAGYNGSNCQTEINECESSPCIHGNCSDHLNNYTCDCHAGYTGSTCQTEINECESSPCIHGNCSDHIGYYTCDCEAGYNGSDCQTEINECESSPCIHGNCSDHLNNYTCDCHAGYTGSTCRTDVDECISSPCVNGSCKDLVNGYQCECMSGYTGRLCEIDIDECADSPCLHGNCSEKVNSFNCSCEPGYTGVFCDLEQYECVSDSCKQGLGISSYLWPLIGGLIVLLLLLVIILIFFGKRYKRNNAVDTDHAD